MSEMEKMDELERELTEALRRVDAPEGFAERVMGRAFADPTHDGGTAMNGATGMAAEAKVVVMPRRQGSLRMKAWVGGAVAAMLALGVFGAEQLHQQRERVERVEAANQEFATTVRITDEALQHARQQLEKAGVSWQ